MKFDRDYFITKILPNISNSTLVLTGESAFVYNGLSLSGYYKPAVLTNKEFLKGVNLEGLVRYCYIPEQIDITHYVKPLEEVPKILVPTIERAIVENIKYDLEFIDEGSFYDSLEMYDLNMELLTEVANHFKVPMSKIEPYLKEASLL